MASPPQGLPDKGAMTRALNEGGLSALPPGVEGEILAELRVLAKAHMAHESWGHTLQVTALINEAFLRLAHPASTTERGFASRGHFLSLASHTMRNVLVDHARRKNSKKRGGDWTRITLALGREDLKTPETNADLLSLSNALDELMTLRSDLAEAIDMRFFGGLDVSSMAVALGVSSRTVERRLRTAIAWLVARLDSERLDA